MKEHGNTKQTVLKRIAQTPYSTLVTLGKDLAKYGCNTYNLTEDNELIRIDFKELVGKSFEGSCTFMVLDAYKTVCFVMREIVANRPTYPCNSVLTS